MREMKDSGIEYVGKIPKDWIMHPVYYYFGERKNRNVLGKEQNLLSLSYGNIIRKDINTSEGLLPASFNTYNIVEKGDIIIRPTDLQNDKRSLRTGLVKERGIITSAYLDLMPIRKINTAYFHYLLHAFDITKVFYNMGNGVRQGLNFSEFSQLMVFEPSEEEQHRISTYLDAKCSEIDALTADIQSQIDTLEQYKRSVITEAVTKGLNRNVEMKESGIEWIGEIPKEWRIFQIKFLCKPNSIKIGPFGSSLSNKTFADAKYNVYGQANLVSGDFSATKNTVTEETFNNLRSYEVIPDDICVSMMGTIGKCRIVPEGISQGIMDSHLIKLRVNETLILPEFFTYVYDKDLGGICYAQMQYEKSGSIMDGLNTSIVKKLYMPIPSIAEQRVLISYLDAKCSEIDETISLKKQQVETLEKLKKSVIYEYVTGKKEVPA